MFVMSCIVFVEAYGDYVKVHFEDKFITTHNTFSRFVEVLPKYFIKTHKSFSINLNKMRALSGNQITIDSHTVPIGQTYKAQLLKALNINT